MIQWGSALAAALVLTTASAGLAEGLRDRLRAFGAAPAEPGQYQDDIRADLGRIGANSEALFGAHRPMLGQGDGPADIALFVSSDCAACATTVTELETLMMEMGQRAALIDISADPADAALMERLTLDLVPSYVLPDKLIRGAFPAFVLRGYLSGARR